MEITVEELAVAYRKAKVDLFYSNDARRLDLLEYEENLEARLSNLRLRINGNDQSWLTDPAFVGTFTLIPKQLRMTKSNSGITRADPRAEWEDAKERSLDDSRPTAEFRLMSRCSIDMHVLSALWIWRVGSKLDAMLGTSARGNRLRRTETEDFNVFASGSFKPYLTPFRTWRDDGLSAMTGALNRGEEVTALTADVTSFYHELDPSFLLNDRFVRDVLQIELDDDEEWLHRLFVGALKGWADHVSIEAASEVRGLPVGLPAAG